MKQHRTLRGTLTSRIKNTIFAAFGENQLPTINMNASIIEIQSWKRSDKVKKCYTKLFSPMKEGQPTTYMAHILAKVWGSKNVSLINIAYAIAICKTFLNPKIEHIQISETVINLKFNNILVSFHNISQIGKLFKC